MTGMREEAEEANAPKEAARAAGHEPSAASGEDAPSNAACDSQGEAAHAAAQQEARAACELAEHNALAAVFDDVRAQSADSALVQPTRWAARGMVPEHMPPDDFEMLVYEYLEEARAARVGADAAQLPVYRSATRAVGVPQFGAQGLTGQDEGGQPGAEGAPEAWDASPLGAAVRGENDGRGASDTDAALAQDADAVAKSADGGGEDGSGGYTGGAASADDAEDLGAPDDPFANLNIPQGYKLVELEGEYVLVPDERAEPVERPIECANVVALVGAHSYYLYDRSCMTDAYAHWAFLAAEDNQVTTFVDCVREDSRVYPRPLAASSLTNEPFNLSDEDVARTWDIVRESGEYPDIGQTIASNGDVYYFSTDYLSEPYAASLAEWDAVERKKNM